MRRPKLIIFLIFIFTSSFNVAFAADEKDCSCPQVSCGPCQKKVTIGKVVKFCDWGDINVCRKVVCENVNFYFSCLSNLNKNNRKPEKENKGEVDLLYEDESGVAKKKSKKKGKRSIASPIIKGKRSNGVQLETPGRVEAGNESRRIASVEYSDLISGQVKSVDQGLKVFHRGQLAALRKKSPLFVGDEILNQGQKVKNVKLKFEQGIVSIDLKPKSKILVEDPHSILGRFQPFMYLVHGGCEFKVDFTSGSFDLLAGQILARAKSGHHQVNYEMDQDGLKVKVESLSESVEVIKAQNLSGQPIQVDAGNFVSWVSETPKNLFSMDEKQALAGEGFITPVFEMPNTEKVMKKVNDTDEGPVFADWSIKPPKGESGRDLASLEGVSSNDLCQTPAAQFQQCAWSCEGNPKGAKNCQAEKSNVHCVRRVCNAAGKWGMPTAFATSYKDLCPSAGVRVGDCSP